MTCLGDPSCAGQELEAQQQRYVISGRAGRALLRQSSVMILPQGLASLFRKRSLPGGGAVPPEAAETMLPPTITIPADLNLESISPADAEKFVNLFSKVAHRGNGGLGDALQQGADPNGSAASTAAPTHDILESGQLLQKIQAEGVPVVHGSAGTPPPTPSKDQSAPAAAAAAPAPAAPPAATPTPAAAAAPTAKTPAPPATAAAPTPAPAAAATPSTGNTTATPASSNATAPASAPSSSNETTVPAAPTAPAEVDVALIPTDPYASATSIPVVPYIGGSGGSFNDAAMQALINKAGGLTAFREKVTKLEAGGQQAGKGSHTLSGGAVAGLVIGLCVVAACGAWFVTSRARSQKGAPRMTKQRSYTSSADAEIEFAGGDTPRAAGHYRSNSAGGGFQPSRAVGRFVGGSYPGQSRN